LISREGREEAKMREGRIAAKPPCSKSVAVNGNANGIGFAYRQLFFAGLRFFATFA
jgi:hypothetical protein